jgi:SAM-dependent methyltransferase
MGVTRPRRGPGAEGAEALAVVWHDLECGAYTADLPLWRELAAPPWSTGAGPILDIGSGTGRVALDLARAGHRVVAIDRDSTLLAALRRRAVGLDVETVCTDARELDLADRGFRLCLVPMLTIQLFGGAERRAEFLSRARAHLAPGGLIACAIVTNFDAFDHWAGDPVPTPDTATLDGLLYRSTTRMVRPRADRIVIVRRREILDPARPQPDDADAEPVLDVVELDRLDPATLEREGEAAGLVPAGVLEVPATEEHVAHEVVMLRA